MESQIQTNRKRKYNDAFNTPSIYEPSYTRMKLLSIVYTNSNFIGEVYDFRLLAEKI
jgi:hypothetical protein